MVAAFSRWFQSASAVWQTLVFVLVVVLIESIRPSLDPHGFWLLYWLTVYSAVTQPALAYASAQSTLEAQKTTAMQMQMLANQADSMKAMRAILEELAKQQAERV